MDFPTTNKQHQDINEQFGENAALLEENLKKVDWKFFAILYAALLGGLLVTIFTIIVAVRLAIMIF